jgi:Putative Ig domain
MLGQTYS